MDKAENCGAGISLMSRKSESLILASRVKGKKPVCARMTPQIEPQGPGQLCLPSEETEDAGFIQQVQPRRRTDGDGVGAPKAKPETEYF